MSSYPLKTQVRELAGKKVRGLRTKGLIPAVLYGHGIKNQNLSLPQKDFLKVFDKAGYSHFVDLQIDEAKPLKTLIYNIQTNPESDEIIHVDFYRIKEDEKLTTEVNLEFVGEAPAVKELGGILVKNMDKIKIECLPKDLELVAQIKVDLSNLKAFNDAIHIKDLIVPPQIKVLAAPDEAVVLVYEPKEEIIEVKPVEEVSAAEVKVAGKEEKEAVAGEVKEEAKGKEEKTANTAKINTAKK